MKAANTSASSHALRSSTRRNRTASPTTTKKMGYDDRIWSATVRASGPLSPAAFRGAKHRRDHQRLRLVPAAARSSHLSPGLRVQPGAIHHTFHAAARICAASVDGDDAVVAFSPALSAGLSLHTLVISTPAEVSDSSIPISTCGRLGECSTSTPRCREWSPREEDSQRQQHRPVLVRSRAWGWPGRIESRLQTCQCGCARRAGLV